MTKQPLDQHDCVYFKFSFLRRIKNNSFGSSHCMYFFKERKDRKLGFDTKLKGQENTC